MFARLHVSVPCGQPLFFFSIWHINGRILLYDKLVISINKLCIWTQ
jgi:hypothetical protein